MKRLFTVMIVLAFVPTQVSGQKTKILVGDKVDYDKMDKLELAKTNKYLSNNMDIVLGFGLKMKLRKVAGKVSAEDSTQEKNAVRFQIGLKLPGFIKTDPPDKVFKVGWDFGVLK